MNNILTVGSYNDLPQVSRPGFAARLRELGFRAVVFHEGLYAGGHVPGHLGYEFAQDANVRIAINAMRADDMPCCVYMHPHGMMRKAHMHWMDVIDEAHRLREEYGFDGLYLDGLPPVSSHGAADMVRAVAGDANPFIVHASEYYRADAPHAGLRAGLAYASYILVGEHEKNPVPENTSCGAWESYKCTVPWANWLYKPGNHTRPHQWRLDKPEGKDWYPIDWHHLVPALKCNGWGAWVGIDDLDAFEAAVAAMEVDDGD